MILSLNIDSVSTKDESCEHCSEWMYYTVIHLIRSVLELLFDGYCLNESSSTKLGVVIDGIDVTDEATSFMVLQHVNLLIIYRMIEVLH